MLDILVKNLVRVKQDFVKNYQGGAHIQEVIPAGVSEEFPMNSDHLRLLHDFAHFLFPILATVDCKPGCGAEPSRGCASCSREAFWVGAESNRELRRSCSLDREPHTSSSLLAHSPLPHFQYHLHH